MLDDNVQAWKAVGMGEQDSTFAKMPYEFECSKSGVEGKKKDIPLCEVCIHSLWNALIASFLIACVAVTP